MSNQHQPLPVFHEWVEDRKEDVEAVSQMAKSNKD